MKFFTLIPYYFAWHYTLGIVNYIKIWGNFIWFTYNYFSFAILLKTLFAPFKRLNEKYTGGLEMGKLFEALVVNIIMRIVGFLMRIVVLFFGVLAILIVFFAGLGLFFVWLALPFILAFFFVASLIALIKA